MGSMLPYIAAPWILWERQEKHVASRLPTSSKNCWDRDLDIDRIHRICSVTAGVDLAWPRLRSQICNPSHIQLEKEHMNIPSGKHTKNHGKCPKRPLLIGKSTMNGLFSIANCEFAGIRSQNWTKKMFPRWSETHRTHQGLTCRQPCAKVAPPVLMISGIFLKYPCF